MSSSKPGGRAINDLHDIWLAFGTDPAKRAAINGDLPPAQNLQSLGFQAFVNDCLAALGCIGFARKEDHANSEVEVVRGFYAYGLQPASKEFNRQLSLYSGAVARFCVGVHSPAMGQVGNAAKGRLENTMASLPVDIGDESNAACVALVFGPIKEPALCGDGIDRKVVAGGVVGRNLHGCSPLAAGNTSNTRPAAGGSFGSQDRY